MKTKGKLMVGNMEKMRVITTGKDRVLMGRWKDLSDMLTSTRRREII